ncbi:MAG: hypothetical protein SNJ52_02825, partial [Verrucomicrobiia bacterium]
MTDDSIQTIQSDLPSSEAAEKATVKRSRVKKTPVVESEAVRVEEPRKRSPRAPRNSRKNDHSETTLGANGEVVVDGVPPSSAQESAVKPSDELSKTVSLCENEARDQASSPPAETREPRYRDRRRRRHGRRGLGPRGREVYNSDFEP